MPRPYSEAFLIDLAKKDADCLGIKLAKLCVSANIPAIFVAVALETSPTTVYGWFRGRGIRENRFRTVEVFIDFLKADLAGRRLPASSVKDAKEYIESIIGAKI
jgi:hypothetical protein